ncbi:YoaK family protein [Algoriphagus resistens]|uniref:YoaK family protein n=1 Tax=Algoriphagus resistens TaxID=1750590 RepID=UPI0007168505|nr:YoaK family protein [Algoriphagus resistens]
MISNHIGRTHRENIQLGSLTAFSAGMVNVISVIIFFAFTSNVTGHYAILAQEISNGNWYQALVVFGWISLFFLGNFTSNIIVINFRKTNAYLAHSIPIVLEILCLLAVGTYIQFYYKETLIETELLVSMMLFAMGIQNGLTATISNSAVKTTHLTGLTTDLGILASLFTKKKNRQNPELRRKWNLLLAIMSSYLLGGVCAGLIYLTINYNVFYIVCFFLLLVIGHDFYRIKMNSLLHKKQPFYRKVLKGQTPQLSNN